jgi:hypothetical protein
MTIGAGRMWICAVAKPLLFAMLASCDDGALIARPTLSVEPSALDFGRVPAGTSRTLALRLFDGSPSAPLAITSIRPSDATPAVFQILDAPASVGPASSAEVRVMYSPDDAEPDAGEIEIHSDAIEGPIIRILLTSARTVPRIAVAPQSLELGTSLANGEARGAVAIESAGDATLVVRRMSLRTLGFPGEVCTDDGDCAEGRCTESRTGLICASPCAADTECDPGYACTAGSDGLRACREGDGTAPPLERRGFSAEVSGPLALLPSERADVPIRYRPRPEDRGSVTLIVESNDPDRPLASIPLAGLVENLPPVAVAALGEAPIDPITPGARILVDGTGSSDPEGQALSHRWRFEVRPEGSRATLDDPSAPVSAFAVDRPGAYVVSLEVRDPSGLASTNDARVSVDAAAGARVRVELTWDSPGADLDLHLVSPGAPIGSLGDCYSDNPDPDWMPPGPGGDPIFSAGAGSEAVALEGHGDGTYTVIADVVASSPQGPTAAVIALFLDDVEVAVYQAVLPSSADAWDVATLSWPSGRIVSLDTIR